MSAAAGALSELEAQHGERLSQQRLALERAEYEAGRAKRQSDACEPENRLVARTVERAYEQALLAVEREQRQLALLEHARPEPITALERAALTQLRLTVRPGTEPHPHRRGHDRARAPARRASSRPRDRRDPRQADTRRRRVVSRNRKAASGAHQGK